MEYQEAIFEYKTWRALGEWARARDAMATAICKRPCDEVLPLLEALHAECLANQKRAENPVRNFFVRWRFLKEAN